MADYCFQKCKQIIKLQLFTSRLEVMHPNCKELVNQPANNILRFRSNFNAPFLAASVLFQISSNRLHILNIIHTLAGLMI